MGVGLPGGRGSPEGEAWLEEVGEVENSAVEAESTIAQVCELLAWPAWLVGATSTPAIYFVLLCLGFPLLMLLCAWKSPGKYPRKVAEVKPVLAAAVAAVAALLLPSRVFDRVAAFY